MPTNTQEKRMRISLLTPHLAHPEIGSLSELRYIRVRLPTTATPSQRENAAVVIREVLQVEHLDLECMYSKYWVDLPFLIDSESVSRLETAGFLVSEIPHTALSLLRGCSGFQDVAAADPRLGQDDYAAFPFDQNKAVGHLVRLYRERFDLAMPTQQQDENGRRFFNIRVYED